MTTLNQSEVGAIQLDGVSETLVASTDSVMARIISINAALAERAARLRVLGNSHADLREEAALKSQIRDLEAEKHALLQELPL